MAWTRNAVLIPAFAFLAVGGVLAGTVQDQERRSVWTGVYSTEQAKRAEGIYAQACAACHGPMLDGGEMAPPLVGSTFNANWNVCMANSKFLGISGISPVCYDGGHARS